MQDYYLGKFYMGLQRAIENAGKVVLMVVIQSKGSSPGRTGFKMWVTETDMSGTIGGGIMEHKLVEYAKTLLQKDGWKPFLKKQFHSKEASKDQSGMICSGEQMIAFYLLMDSDLHWIEAVRNSSGQTISFTQNGISFGGVEGVPATYNNDEQSWELKEDLKSSNEVYVIGGGHVGRALCEILSFLDFEIHQLDHRASLNTMENNPFAAHKSVIDYNEIDQHIPEGPDVYVVIMSFGYRTDEIILRRLLGKKFRYIGMMGSKKKVKMMFDQFIAEGIDPALLQELHTPIGIDINSETAYEIAISVASELIKLKNKER
ncbi:MAG: XdhC family protein [Saprospiraceae bacterium]|nr:XdhC family protein [Saprospiraceae bacterium]